jgi:hypothetical protein
VVAGLPMKVQRALGFEPMRKPPARAARICGVDAVPGAPGLASTPKRVTHRG